MYISSFKHQKTPEPLYRITEWQLYTTPPYPPKKTRSKLEKNTPFKFGTKISTLPHARLLATCSTFVELPSNHPSYCSSTSWQHQKPRPPSSTRQPCHEPSSGYPHTTWQHLCQHVRSWECLSKRRGFPDGGLWTKEGSWERQTPCAS